MNFVKGVGVGMSAGFMVLMVGAVGNGLSTYLLNGKTFQDLIDERTGNQAGGIL